MDVDGAAGSEIWAFVEEEHSFINSTLACVMNRWSLSRSRFSSSLMQRVLWLQFLLRVSNAWVAFRSRFSETVNSLPGSGEPLAKEGTLVTLSVSISDTPRLRPAFNLHGSAEAYRTADMSYHRLEVSEFLQFVYDFFPKGQYYHPIMQSSWTRTTLRLRDGPGHNPPLPINTIP